MGITYFSKFQSLPRCLRAMLLTLAIFHCQLIWAVQDAMVVVERGVIYTDEKMSSPVGFARKGKKIKVGDNPRNNGQVYPVIVSGRIGFIRVSDVSTEKESADAEFLVSERFKKSTVPRFKSNFSVGAFMYSSQISLNAQNDNLKDGDPVNWTGLSLKGGIETVKRIDVEFILNYMSATQGGEVFRAVEAGLGASVRLFEVGRLIGRLNAYAMGVPYASYALDDLFRMNGSGYSAGVGAGLTYRMGQSWGIELYGGLHYLKLMGIEPPSPYKSIEPSFTGSRIGVGANYQF